MRRAIGAARAVLWACAALVAVLVVLAWAAPGLRDERSFLPHSRDNTRARHEQVARMGVRDA